MNSQQLFTCSKCSCAGLTTTFWNGRLMHSFQDVIDRLQVTLEKRVAGLRFLLACMTAWGLSYPLTEETFVTRLRQWASERFELGTSE